MRIATKRDHGFTLLELLIVVAIIGLLAAIVVVALNGAREGGRDGGRKTQVQEFIKALELYYSDNGVYPAPGGTPSYPVDFASVESELSGSGYLRAIPEDPLYGDAGYQYCVSPDQSSYTIAVNTEEDGDGSDFCHVTRGTGSDFGCASFIADGAVAADQCTTRF